MDQHKFKKFLESRLWSDTLGRQFVDHALGDRQMPDVGSWQELEAYLKEYDAPEERIRAAEYVWQLYAKGNR